MLKSSVNNSIRKKQTTNYPAQSSFIYTLCFLLHYYISYSVRLTCISVHAIVAEVTVFGVKITSTPAAFHNVLNDRRPTLRQDSTQDYRLRELQNVRRHVMLAPLICLLFEGSEGLDKQNNAPWILPCPGVTSIARDPKVTSLD